jgi:hypothetical protein
VGFVGRREDGSTFCRRVPTLQARNSNNLGGFVGPDAPQQISSLAMDGDAVWAASGPHVMKYHRGKEVYCPSPMIGAWD